MGKERKQKKTTDYRESCSTEFISVVSNDLLSEIFLRLQRGRDIIRCGAVCKRWFALTSEHQFIRKFTQHKQYSSNSTILLRYSSRISKPFHRLSPSEPNPYTASYDDIVNYLDILPEWPNVVIRASCDDLLLVSSLSRRSNANFYICNPITKQWFSLPKSSDNFPHGIVAAYGLVFEPAGSSSSTKFKVVLVYSIPGFMVWGYCFVYLVFCSETGVWMVKIAELPVPLPRNFRKLCPVSMVLDVVTRNGVMYWLDGVNSSFKGVAALNVFGGSSDGRIISLPDDFSPRTSSKGGVCLGLVKGQLRLAQIVGANHASMALKVWELADCELLSDSVPYWVLMHKKCLLKKSGVFSLLAFDPTNCNAVFMARDHEIGQFKIQEGEYKTIARFPGKESADIIKERIDEHLKVFTLMHPLWPTILPAFPSTQS